MTQAEVIVKVFNAFYCEGSKVKYRLWADDDSTVVEMTVKTTPFITHHFIPAVFFKEKQGYFSIEPKHVVYPPYHECYENNPDNPTIVVLPNDCELNKLGERLSCKFDAQDECIYCGLKYE